MNRPYGAVDVAANLKGLVTKATTQKILVALAEKGELVQKNYGAFCVGRRGITTQLFLAKTTFFVANQAKIATLAPEQLTSLEEEYKTIDEENKTLTARIKTANAGISRRLKSLTTLIVTQNSSR